jgi:hypothetical protein
MIARKASGWFFKPVSNRPDRCRLEMGVFDDRDKSMRGVEVAERQRDDVQQVEHANLSGSAPLALLRARSSHRLQC